MLYHIHSPTILHLSKFEQIPSSHLDQPQKQMDYQKNSSSCSCNSVYTHEKWETMLRASDNEEALMTGLRKGPWTEEEDSKLTSAVATHGVGRWNELANIAGLRRSGKSCRLRWLNYLRPDLRRGGFTLEEQLVILELHLRWGNRWSKIAENLPGRTDNEIKNYWRTKVPKLARQFKCNVNSLEFKDTLRNIWIPRLAEQIRANASPTSNTTKPQNEGPSTECGIGPENTYSSSSSSSEDCLFDTTASWAQTSLDQHDAGPVDLITEPNNLTHSCEAHISPESGSSVELDPYWEQNLNDFLWDMTLYDENNIIYDGNHILFLQQQLDYLDM